MTTPREMTIRLRCEPLADRLAPGGLVVVGDVAPSPQVPAVSVRNDSAATAPDSVAVAVIFEPSADDTQEPSAAPQGSDRQPEPVRPPVVGMFEAEILPDGSRVIVVCFSEPSTDEGTGMIVPPVSSYLLPQESVATDASTAPPSAAGRPDLAVADSTS